jgi:hypothetical protein
MKRTLLSYMGQQTTLPIRATVEIQQKMPTYEKILLPRQIAHIYFCLPKPKPTQRQKSAITNDLLQSQSPMKLSFMNSILEIQNSR